MAISSQSLPISHLFFADDNFFFLDFDIAKIWCLKWLIDSYCEFSGQLVNKNKSEIFVSPCMLEWQRGFLVEVLGVKIVKKPGIYLGSNLDISRKK